MSRFQGLEGLPPDRLAPLNAHNKYQDVDRLYDPLREISSPAHQQRVNGGMARGSRVSSQVHQLSQQEMNALRSATLIPAEDRLIPTHDLTPIKSRGNFVAVDARQKVGAPLTPQQMQQRLKTRPSDEVVVYQLGSQAQPPPPPPLVSLPPPPAPPAPAVVIQRPLGVNQYRIPQFVETLPRNSRQYKYNLYSMIDQPVNKMLDAPGCNFGLCGWAPNEYIASRNQAKNSWLN